MALEGPDASETGDEPAPREDAGSAMDAEAVDLDGSDVDGSSVDGSSAADAYVLDAAASAPDATGLDAGDDASSNDARAADDAAKNNDASLGPEKTETFYIAADEDDAVWYTWDDFVGFRELLHFNPAVNETSGFTIEVGADATNCRAGLRFRLPLAVGSRVLRAVLKLKRMEPNGANATDTMRVQVYDVDDMPPFNGTHNHEGPDEHVSGGLWSLSIGGLPCGRAGETISSQDLSRLVQHVVDRPGWHSDAYLGFALFPEHMAQGTWAPMGDFYGGQSASLTLTWQAPGP